MTSHPPKTTTSYVNGKPMAAPNNATLPNIDPATGEVVGEIQLAEMPEINAAVTAATKAQRDWKRLTGVQRGRVLVRAATLLRERNDALATLEVRDTGKPISEALTVDVQSGADALEYFGGLAGALCGEYYPQGRNFAYTRREPFGVVGAIGAWNYPLQIACWKAAPALAAGNAVIFKPSELTPCTAVSLAEVLQEAGLPNGLFNVIQGDARTGQMLVEHPGVHKVSLTGSVETGRKIMASASKQIKPVSLELGGKSPLILFEDAHLKSAVEGAFLANFYTQGEICTNGTRVFVHQSLLEGFLTEMVKKTLALRVGDPMDPQTQVGALISEAHLKRVLDYIAKGRSEGAKLLCGGERIGDRGNFVSPAIFSACRDDMTIVQEEIFGPVMSVLSFETEDEVIERANATHFGLASGVFTRDLNRAHRVAAELQAGTCWINTYNIAPVEIPFGGWKESGVGVENSQWALDHYTRRKAVYVETGELS